jgi:hypothetical protein
MSLTFQEMEAAAARAETYPPGFGGFLFCKPGPGREEPAAKWGDGEDLLRSHPQCAQYG